MHGEPPTSVNGAESTEVESVAAAGPSDSASGIRASDAEREAVVARVHVAGSEGRLTLEEIEQRTGAAYAARYRHELPPLTCDLPVPESKDHHSRGWAGLWEHAINDGRAALTGSTINHRVPNGTQRRVAALIALIALFWFSLWLLAGFGLGVMA